jgi:hypothetical protein
VLRPGNAGANTAADHIEIVELVLDQLPHDAVEHTPIVVRTDSAAATHQLTDELRAARINFLMGFDLTETIREAILALPEAAWRPALRQDGKERDGAWVAEITDRLDPVPRARRRARRLRTQDAALPAAAHRRPPRLPRPPCHAAPPTQLALGAPTGRGLRPAGRPTTTRALTARAAASRRQHATAPPTTTAAHTNPPPSFGVSAETRYEPCHPHTAIDDVNTGGDRAARSHIRPLLHDGG